MLKRLKKILLFNFKKDDKDKGEKKQKAPVRPIIPDSNYVAKFFANLEEGRKWCHEVSMHWAEKKVFEFSKAIITFDLALLGFNVSAQNFFGGEKNLLTFSVVTAIVSMVLLVWFIWSVANKNIKNVTERRYVIEKTMMNLMKGNDKDVMDKYNDDMNNIFLNLNEHEKTWMPIQRIGIYLFIFSVIATTVGFLI